MIYQPSEDSFLLAEQVKKCAKGKSVLDMGSGSGIQAETALQAGARSVFAVDIQDDVIAYLESKKILAIKSDLFQNVQGIFDLIVCNPPYLPENAQEDVTSKKATTGGTRGDEFLLRFLEQAPQHLAQKGVILIVLSSLTPKKRIQEILRKCNFIYSIIATKKVFMESLEVWEVKHKVYK